MGLALLVWGLATPPFVDEARSERAFMAWCNADAEIDQAAGEAYLQLLTSRYTLIDTGAGLLLAGFSVAALATLLNRRLQPGLSWFRTPARKVLFIAAGLVAIAAGWGAVISGLMLDHERKLFPWCADSVIIPMLGLSVVALIATPALIVGGVLIMRQFGSLPAPLGQWDTDRPVRSWLVTIIFGSLAAAFSLLPATGMSSSIALATPAIVIATYLAAATRAALLAPRSGAGEREAS